MPMLQPRSSWGMRRKAHVSPKAPLNYTKHMAGSRCLASPPLPPIHTRQVLACVVLPKVPKVPSSNARRQPLPPAHMQAIRVAKTSQSTRETKGPDASVHQIMPAGGGMTWQTPAPPLRQSSNPVNSSKTLIAVNKRSKMPFWPRMVATACCTHGTEAARPPAGPCINIQQSWPNKI